VRLDSDAAHAAIEPLAAALGLEPLDCAAGIIRVANAEMVRALRVMTVERGIDPRAYALMPFGGAGPLHAAAIAEQLGIDRIFCPRASGVLSALGLVAAPPRRDAASSYGGLSVDELRRRVRDELGAEPARERVLYELRYVGQSFELAVEAPPDADELVLHERFAEAHERRYGYREPDGEIELVTVRVSAWGESPALSPPPVSADGRRDLRRASFEGAERDIAVFIGQPPAEIGAPAICALPEATLLIPPGWRGRAHADGTIELRREPAAGRKGR
jgi:N-methylhydantoinase A